MLGLHGNWVNLNLGALAAIEWKGTAHIYGCLKTREMELSLFLLQGLRNALPPRKTIQLAVCFAGMCWVHSSTPPPRRTLPPPRSQFAFPGLWRRSCSASTRRRRRRTRCWGGGAFCEVFARARMAVGMGGGGGRESSRTLKTTSTCSKMGGGGMGGWERCGGWGGWGGGGDGHPKVLVLRNWGSSIAGGCRGAGRRELRVSKFACKEGAFRSYQESCKDMVIVFDCFP